MVKLQTILIGGAAISLGALIYYLSDDGTGPQPSSASLRRDQVITILKDLKKELSNVYITISTFASSINERSGGRLPEGALKEILITQTPIQSFITRAETKVYEQHGITEAELKAAVDSLQSDAEVKSLITEMKKNLESAYKGVAPIDDTPLPGFLTAEITLKILFDMFDQGKYITYKQLAELKSRGITPNPNSEEFMKAMQEMEIEAEEEKNAIFEKHGLNKFEDAPMNILRKAQQKYSASEPGFRQKASMLEEEYGYTMGLIMEDKLPAQEVQRLTKKYGKE